VFPSAVEILQHVARLDVRAMADDELESAAVLIERARALVDIAEAHVLAELERRGCTDRDYGLSTRSWLANRADIPVVTAGDRVRKANQIARRLPTVDAAVVDGTLTFEHARALANASNGRVEHVLAGAQEQIIELAADSPFAQWHGQVRRLAALLDQDGPPPEADESTNRLNFRRTLDGITYMDGAMTPDIALALMTAVEERANDLHRRARRDHEQTPDLDVPSRPTLRMRALVELVSAAYTATGQGRAEVTLIVRDHETTDLAGRPIPRAAAGVWGCDPELWAVVVDHLGEPLDVGHTRRLATAAMRRAVAVRDRGCVFPGCDQPIPWCDFHHVRPFDAGGRTSVENLAALCRHHHTVTHRAGWSMRWRAGGGFEWTTPTGAVLSERSPPDARAA
jgi:hypothetical protein